MSLKLILTSSSPGPRSPRLSKQSGCAYGFHVRLQVIIRWPVYLVEGVVELIRCMSLLTLALTVLRVAILPDHNLPPVLAYDAIKNSTLMTLRRFSPYDLLTLYLDCDCAGELTLLRGLSLRNQSLPPRHRVFIFPGHVFSAKYRR
jgi:hypothetical protein